MKSKKNSISDWSMVLLLPMGSFHGGHSFSVGKVEINYKAAEPSDAIQALQVSQQSFNYAGATDPFPRAKVVVRDKEKSEALIIGSEEINQVLDLINFSASDFGDIRTLGIGYFQDLKTKDYSPIKRDDDPSLSPVFVMDQELDNPYPWNLFRMILEKSPQDRTELEKLVLRAASWIRQAKFQRNTIRELLFRWIAMEILMKEGNEIVAPKALVAIGLPHGKIFKGLNRVEQQRLNSSSKFKPWKCEIQKRFGEIQRLRNAIVHEGFKDVELSDVGCRHPLETYLKLMHMAAARSTHFACGGILMDCKSVSELWQRKEAVFMNQNPTPSHDILGNVIPILES